MDPGESDLPKEDHRPPSAAAASKPLPCRATQESSSYFFDHTLSQNSCRLQQQYQDQDGEGNRVAIGGLQITYDHYFSQSDDETAYHRSGNISNAAQDSSNKRL